MGVPEALLRLLHCIPGAFHFCSQYCSLIFIGRQFHEYRFVFNQLSQSLSLVNKDLIRATRPGVCSAVVLVWGVEAVLLYVLPIPPARFQIRLLRAFLPFQCLDWAHTQYRSCDPGACCTNEAVEGPSALHRVS